MQAMHRPVPFDTGKVKIGAAYDPSIRARMTASEERLQRALLARPKPRFALQLQNLLRLCFLG